MKSDCASHIVQPPVSPRGPKGFLYYDAWELYWFFHSIASEGYIYYSNSSKIHLTRLSSLRIALPSHGPWISQHDQPYESRIVVESDVSICLDLNPRSYILASFAYQYVQVYKYDGLNEEQFKDKFLVYPSYNFFNFYRATVPLKHVCKNCLKVAPEMGQIERSLF